MNNFKIRATIAEELRRSPRFINTQKYPESGFDSSTNQTILSNGLLKILGNISILGFIKIMFFSEPRTVLQKNYNPEKTLGSKIPDTQSRTCKRKSQMLDVRIFFKSR